MAISKKQQKDQEQRKIFDGVFDNLAIKDLFKMKTKGIFDVYKGVWKEGKESRILLVKRDRDKKETYGIIKIYKVEASNFKNMQKYLVGDARFQEVKDNKRSMVYIWCKKEYHNLLLAREAGVNAPEPWYHVHNIIAMELIGTSMPASQLKEVELTKREAKASLSKILENIRKLYQKAKLVHGDISEYNILLPPYKIPYLIDFGQAVLTSHPLATEFLKRDVRNIINYFAKKYRLIEKSKIERETEKIFKYITKKERSSKGE